MAEEKNTDIKDLSGEKTILSVKNLVKRFPIKNGVLVVLTLQFMLLRMFRLTLDVKRPWLLLASLVAESLQQVSACYA